MMREINPDFGFQSATGGVHEGRSVAEAAEHRAGCGAPEVFPEFINRIDHVITYQPLDAESFAAITDHEIDKSAEPREHAAGNRCFMIEVPFETRQWLIERGTSPEYGARELKRTIQRV